mmetsp:Transcript_2619/g.2598  ORF Transcript_2619/g.2598 Transcript_2619/m.2598 type:complete len:252 (+) Transcript_2619:34-789(+)
MPPPKATAGYTKAAQKIKYVRNRDLKLSGKELKEEERIQRGMTEGICSRCREKLQWRFQFNKYKPLKNLANCQGCKRKCITKAYRTLCDDCSHNKNVCPSCCQDFQILTSERKERDKFLGINEDNNDNKEISNNDMEEVNEDNNNYKSGGDNNEDDEEAEEDEDDNNNEDNDDTMEQEPGTKRGFQQSSNEQTSSSLFTGSLNDWNSRKFDDIVASKYSKARVTGSIEDNIQTGVINNSNDNDNEVVNSTI